MLVSLLCNGPPYAVEVEGSYGRSVCELITSIVADVGCAGSVPDPEADPGVDPSCVEIGMVDADRAEVAGGVAAPTVSWGFTGPMVFVPDDSAEGVAVAGWTAEFESMLLSPSPFCALDGDTVECIAAEPSPIVAVTIVVMVEMVELPWLTYRISVKNFGGAGVDVTSGAGSVLDEFHPTLLTPVKETCWEELDTRESWTVLYRVLVNVVVRGSSIILNTVDV